MVQSKVSPSALEMKVDALAGQLAELSFITKKTQTRIDELVFGRTCSYCKRPGHDANLCNANRHRETQCQRCGKLGHSEKHFWARIGPGWANEISLQTQRTQTDAVMSTRPTHGGGNEMSVVDHENVPADKELVASVKRIVDGEPVAKTQKGDDWRTSAVPP